MTRIKGFTLVEMAVALVVAGAVLAAGLKMLTVQSQRTAISITKTNQQAIKSALINHLGRYGRLPCPDSDIDGLDNDRTASGCNANSGPLPYLDLGLEQSTVLDGWGNYITYKISPGWVKSYSSTTNDTKYTSVITDAFWPGVRAGAISVNTRRPPDYELETISTNIAVALISHGATAGGAIKSDRSPNYKPLDSTDEYSNADAGAVSIFKRDYTEDEDSEGGAFDDVVMTISADDFDAELARTGAAEAVYPQTIFKKAQDIVLVKILDTRTLCDSSVCDGHYYTLDNTSFIFPDELAVWNIHPDIPNSVQFDKNSLPTGVCYTITVSPRNIPLSKSVSCAELKSQIALSVGFN